MGEICPGTRRFLHGAAVAVASAVVVLVLWGLGGLTGMEAATFDWRARLLARPSAATDDIRLILLDQSSLDWAARENGLNWPWPREMYAAVANFCARAGVASLGFDVLFTEPSSYGVDDDEALGQAAKNLGPTVLAAFLGRTSGEDLTWPAAIARPPLKVTGVEEWLASGGDLASDSYARAAFPVEQVAAGARLLAHVGSNVDPDGVNRRVSLVSFFDGQPLPSLGLGGWLAATGTTEVGFSPGAFIYGDRSAPMDNEGRAVINFRGPGGTYKAYGAAGIIASEIQLMQDEKPAIDPAELAGKHLLFGFSAPGLFDLRPTPMGGIFSGVEIHATVLDNLITGDFLRPAPVWAGIALICLAALTMGLAASLAPGAGATALAALIVLPLPSLAAAAAYRAGIWLPMAGPSLAALIALFGSLAVSYATEGRQRRFIKGAFGQYLSPLVIEELIRHPERMCLGGELRTLSIFFSDLEGFTSISEGLSPEELTSFLNDYLTAMTDIILDEGGTVDKYEGDAIIAFWNAPLDQPDHAARAIRAALRCQEALTAMQDECVRRVGRGVRMRIGLNSGPAVVGNLGSNKRFDYSMLGDSVNLASRLEGVNKQFFTLTIASKAALEAALKASGKEFAARELARVVVVGKSEPLTIFEPMRPGEYEERRPVLEIFARGLAAFYRGELAAAQEIFESIADRDGPARAYAAKCKELMNGMPEGWSGEWVMTTK